MADVTNYDPNMLAYVLAAAGGAIGGEGSMAKSLSSPIMALAGGKMQEARQDKRTQNFVDMLGKALKDPNSKTTIQGDKIKMEVPTGSLTPGSSNENVPDMGKALASALAGVDNVAAPVTAKDFADNTLNNQYPFSEGLSADFLSNADLTGMAPEDINSALAIQERRALIPAENTLRQLKIIHTTAQIENLKEDNVRQWYTTLTKDDRTELQKNFDAFNTELQNNKKKPISMEQYVMITGNDSYKDFILSKTIPGYEGFITKMKKAGATTVNVGEKAYETDLGHQRASLESPDYMQKLEEDERKVISSDFEKSLKTPSGRRAARNDKRTEEQKKLDTEHKVRLSVIKRYDRELRNKYGSENVILQQDPKTGAVGWYRKGENGEAILVRSY